LHICPLRRAIVPAEAISARRVNELRSGNEGASPWPNKKFPRRAF
jgi:hypothetical protein